MIMTIKVTDNNIALALYHDSTTCIVTIAAVVKSMTVYIIMLSHDCEYQCAMKYDQEYIRKSVQHT